MRVLCLLAFSRLISDSTSGFAKNRFMPRTAARNSSQASQSQRHVEAGPRPCSTARAACAGITSVNGKDETHPEGSYFIEWWDEGKRHCEPAGADAQDAADKARVKQAELTAQRNGILPPAPTVEAAQERTSLPLRSTAIWNMFAITDPCVPSAPTGPFLNRSKSLAPRPMLTRLNVKTFSTLPLTA